MSEYTSDYAGGATTGLVVTCILNEGAPSVSASAYDVLGQKQSVITWNAELDEGDWVALANDSVVLYDVCEGAPVVEKAVNGDALVIGRIVSLPRMLNTPATDEAANDLDERLAGKYYRYANVEIMGGITSIQEATVTCDGSNATVIGVGGTLNFDMSLAYAANGKLQFVQAAENGVGVIPFHTVPSTASGDTYSCLVGITGLLYSVT